MFNIMLDKLPTEYKGYPINSDFRIGVQIFQVFNDTELSEVEQTYKACDLLFGTETTEKLPGIHIMQEGMQWFLFGWYMDNQLENQEESKRDMDYDIDQWRIYSAFLAQFGINLNTVDMHFWVFMGLLSTLEECAFTRVVDIRTKKIDPKMPPSDKKELRKVKERYALEKVEEKMTPREKAAYDTFMKYAKKGNQK